MRIPAIRSIKAIEHHYCMGKFYGMFKRKYKKMSNCLKYSIIYAVIRPEISERVSVGLIIVDGDKIDIRYSRQKLNAIQPFFSEKEYKFVSRVVISMKKNQTINSTEAINYLTRYSNNLISVSPLQAIDVEPTKQIKEKLFKSYVYEGSRKSA